MQPSVHLAALLTSPEDRIDLAEAALLVAQPEYPDLSVAEYVGRLDAMGRELALRLGHATPAAERVEALHQYLFGDLGYRGNVDEYYDPRNSFLNEVIERRTGIPLTLSIVYMEVARRIGLDASGISFPGHFLVRLDMDQGVAVIDPFLGGLSLGARELEERFHQLAGEDARFDLAKAIEPASKREILLRLLRNLKGVYAEKDDGLRTLGVLNQMLVIDARLPNELRERGQLWAKLECFGSALADLKLYLEISPDASDYAEVYDQVGELTPLAARVS